jgi:hypothetical protein
MATIEDIKNNRQSIRELVDELHAQHRTTQADTVSAMCKALAIWAVESSQQGRVDNRNKRAVKEVMYLLNVSEDDQRQDHLEFYTC